MEIIYKPKTYTTREEHITRREVEILSLIAEGNVNKQIATLLNISPETVKTHVRNLYSKIGAHNKVEALNKTKWLTTSYSFLPAQTNC